MFFLSSTNSRRGIALLNLVFIFIFIGVLVGAGLKMYGPMVVGAKIKDTKGGLEDKVRMITAWAARNGRLPKVTDLPSVFGTKGLVDAWGRPILYYTDTNLTDPATGGLCGRTSSNLSDAAAPGVSVAFALFSAGDDATFQTKVAAVFIEESTEVSAGTAVTTSQDDLFKIVPLEELKSKAGCYGPTGGRLTILNNELPAACAGGTVYPATLFASGGVPGYKWSLASQPASPWNQLLIGLETGVLSPNARITTTPGSYIVTAQLMDSTNLSLQRTYPIRVSILGSCSSACQADPNCSSACREDTACKSACEADPACKAACPDCVGTTSGSAQLRDHVASDNVFVYGSQLSFSGSNVTGVNSTTIITGGLSSSTLNGNAKITVSNIYIDGDVSLGNSQELGSSTNPGVIYISGKLTMSGSAKIHGSLIYIGGRESGGDLTMTSSNVLGGENKPCVIYVKGNANLSGTARVSGTEIRVNGKVTMDSAVLGLSDRSSNIYMTGDLSLPNGTIYGEVHVGGNTYLKDTTVGGNIYSYGNLTLAYGQPNLQNNSHVYCRGTISSPFGTSDPPYKSNDSSIAAVSPFVKAGMMPGYAIPSLKADNWYEGLQSPYKPPLSQSPPYIMLRTPNAAHNPELSNNIKILSFGTYSAPKTYSTVNNVIIVSKKNIYIDGWGVLSGVLFAPEGKVTYNGEAFSGVVIARDGFFVTSGSTPVNFLNINNYISDPDNYPF